MLASGGCDIIDTHTSLIDSTRVYRSCTASNEFGESATSATIVVVPQTELMERSQIYDVEDARELAYSSKSGVTAAPRFVAPLRDFHCADGIIIHSICLSHSINLLL